MENSDVEYRRAYRRKKARNRHLKVFFILFLILALIVSIILSLTVLFPIKNIFVKGNTVYEHVQIKKECELTDKNIFTFSQNKIETNLRKKMPYIEKVDIKRKLPDTVTLSITDAKNYATYKVSGSYYGVSKIGYVLCKTNAPIKDTVEIITSKVKCEAGNKIVFEDEKIKNNIDLLLSKMEENKIAVNYIDYSEINNITMQVNGRFKVLLGGSSYLENKCAHLVGMIKNISDNEKGTINLSMWTNEKSEGTFIKGAEN